MFVVFRILYNYHPCWSVTRRFVSPRKVRSNPRVTLPFSGRQTVGSQSNKGDNCILSLICFVRMDFSEQYHIKGEAWDAIRSLFLAKNVNESMFSEDLYIFPLICTHDNIFTHDNIYYHHDMNITSPFFCLLWCYNDVINVISPNPL